MEGKKSKMKKKKKEAMINVCLLKIKTKWGGYIHDELFLFIYSLDFLGLYLCISENLRVVYYDISNKCLCARQAIISIAAPHRRQPKRAYHWI